MEQLKGRHFEILRKRLEMRQKYGSLPKLLASDMSIMPGELQRFAKLEMRTHLGL